MAHISFFRLRDHQLIDHVYIRGIYICMCSDEILKVYCFINPLMILQIIYYLYFQGPFLGVFINF